MPKRTASSSKKGHQPDSYGSLTGTGSRPKAVGSPVVKPTSMGGTLEEPQSTAHMNTTLGQSHVNLPSRTMTWRTPKTKLHMTTHAPDKGGRSNPNEVVERPYCHFTVNTTSKLKLRTKNASASSYYGVMFSVTALRRPIRITQLHMASGAWRRELYRVYMKQGGISNQMVDPLQWGEVAAGETELPALTKGIYGAVPFPYDGIKIQPGCTVSIYVHSPYHQHGVAFRRFAKSWPGYPSFDASTDKNDDISIGVARATYSQTPFERLSQEGYAFAGLVEYSPCEEEKNMLRSSPRR
ncbi:hypothetical protein T484DRAFT_1798236, partial [Baffinella frigidus]